MFPKTGRLLYTLPVAILLSACGGGHDNGSMPTTPPPPTRGQLLGTPTATGTYSPSDLLSDMTGDPLGKLLLQL
ncbi:MAG TPA: hypothetical protein VI653_00220, partial [Steroidobacteraceae bacterium]